jgi:hypothetical protein
MALTYSIDPEARLVTILYAEHPPIEAWKRTMLQVFADPRYRPGFAFLGDRRRVAEPPDRLYIQETIAFGEEHRAELKGARWATLVATPASYGMARMGQALGETGPTELGAFTDLAAALRWLRGDAEEEIG